MVHVPLLNWFIDNISRKFTNESVRRTAAYGLAMLLTSSILAPYLAATADQQSNFMDPWWYNSCDINTGHRQRRHLTPADCSTTNRVEHHFQTVKKQLTLLKSTYNLVSPKFHKVERFEGLFQWLPNITNKIKYKKRTELQLPEMHENLQKYAVAVQYLMKLDIQTDAVHDNDVRLKLLADLSGNIKSLLCEIEEALNLTCQVLPTRIPPTYPEAHNLSHTVNLTEMRMRDKEVMSKLYSAIINWEKLAKRLARKRGEIDWDIADVMDM
ncbi:hypothetical protein CBL_07544 [Carabus blaptoides fortunei]